MDVLQHDTSDNLCDKDSGQNRDIRNMRNLAEKQRRDKLNGYINELANTVPLVTMSSKRLDKTSVLRLSAAYLRLHKTNLTMKKAKEKIKKQTTNQLWRPPKFRFDHLRSLIDSVEGFIIVTTGSGKIIYVSHSVENFLGHQNIEMIGHSLTSFLHPNDIDLVQSQIQSAHEQVFKGSHTSDKMSFQCRLREKNQPRSEVVTYQMVNVSGTIENTERDLEENGHSSNDDKHESSVLFKGFVQIIPTNPMAELSLMDADLDEYVSRHSLDGTLLFADHRISGIIGWLPSEVLGKSAYNYILPEDHSIALFAQKLMLSNSNGTGCIVHRLRTSNGSSVFLQSSGCLQYDKNGQIDHWICVSRLLVEQEGEKERDKFVKRFTPHIYNISPTALYESLQIVIGPRATNANFSSINCLTEGNKGIANSIRIREIESPSPSTESHKVTQKTLNSLTFTSSLSASASLRNSSEKSTVSLNTTHTTLPQKLEAMSPLPINTFLRKLTPGPHLQSVPTVQSVQSSPVMQIQALPIIPTQILTQQTAQTESGPNLSRSDSFSVKPNVINLIAPSPTVSLSYVNTVADSQANKAPLNHQNDSGHRNLIAGHFSNLNIISKPTHDLTHLLGATVLTFDSQNTPVLSVYSPTIAAEETNRLDSNQKTELNINSSANGCPEPSDVSSPMDTSFYSPNATKPVSKMTNGDTSEDFLWPQNGHHFEEMSNHSTNSLLDFPFPSNDSQSE